MSEAKQRADGTGSLSLVRKLAEVMGAVSHVPKNGSNSFHNYKYATEADIVASVRKEMAARSIILIPTVLKTEWTRVPRRQGGEDRLCTLTVRFTVHDGESGEELSFEVLGEGQDAGDKATYKAFTGAVKYALLKLFLIPTGDDPEHEDGGQEERRSESGKERRKPSKKGEAEQPAPPAESPPRSTPTASPVVGFGPYKKATIAELTDDGLAESIDVAEQKLAEKPDADWAAATRQKLELLKAEKARRASSTKAS